MFNHISAAFVGSLLLLSVGGAQAEMSAGSAFTYQGRLNTSGSPAAGAHDFEFALFDDLAGGNQVGTTVSLTTDVTAGLFSAPLDFGPGIWTGNRRWLQVQVRPGGGGNYTGLLPRTEVTPAPYALQALASLDSDKLGNIDAAQYQQAAGDGSGLTNLDASNLTTGTVEDALLSDAVARRNTAQTFTGDQAIAGNFGVTGAMATFSNALVATGTLGSSSEPPVTGSGERMMWWPGRGAFRAGAVGSTQWDVPNVGYYSTAFGLSSTASGTYSFAQGDRSIASGLGAIAMGTQCVASRRSSTAIGYRCVADGDYSVAMGNRADDNGHNGCFVFADASTIFTPLEAFTHNQFLVRASGGVRFYSNSAQTAGVTLPAGSGTWTSLSDRNAKDNIAAVNPGTILEGVLKLPIATWNYKTQEKTIRHIGPMAQDFFAAFNVGEDDTHISTVDPDGVALAAIQGLHAELVERDEKLEDQQKQIDELKAQVAELSTLKETMAKQQASIEAIQALLENNGNQ